MTRKWANIRMRKALVMEAFPQPPDDAPDSIVEQWEDSYDKMLRDGIPAEWFDTKTRKDMQRIPNIGKSAIREIEQWLGREFPDPKDIPFHIRRDIENAVKLLESHGYKVIKPVR